LRLAETAPPYINSGTLRRIAVDYLEMALRLEEAERREGRKPGRA
jgi:hypothetical protein